MHLELNAPATKRPMALSALEKSILMFTLGFLAEYLYV
jgi:hypothetical protein